MRVVDYKQTKNKYEAVSFINAMPDECVYEITVHGKALDYAKGRPLKVYIDDQLAYTLNPAENSYWNKRLGDFYLSEGEGWQLCKYLECYAEGGVTPHWWPYAKRNIQRHEDPLAEFRVAKLQGADIKIRFLE
jgi:hypothetical protein